MCLLASGYFSELLCFRSSDWAGYSVCSLWNIDVAMPLGRLDLLRPKVVKTVLYVVFSSK